MPVIIPVVEVVVHHSHRVAIIAYRTPSYVVIAPVPVDPRRPPNPGWNPIPSKP